MQQTLSFKAPAPQTDLAAPARSLTALAQTIASRCEARGAVLLQRGNTKWRVAVSIGCAAFRLPEGTTLDVAANPSLQLDNVGPEGVSVNPDPFTIAMGPMAHWDSAICPVVTHDSHVGTLYLFSDWDRPFTSTQVELATFATELMAPQLIAPDAAEAPAATPDRHAAWPDMELAVSLLNHDLRSPINAILGFAELMAEGDLDAETVARYAGIIAKGGNNMSVMLDQTVAMMRMVLGKTDWTPMEAPLADALNGLNLEGVADGMVTWDMARMRDAIAALSAKTETENSGQVAVTTTATHVHLTVGIPGEGEHPLSNELRHLGAQMARQVIQWHRGDIRSDELGTWFQVTLPRHPDHATPTSA